MSEHTIKISGKNVARLKHTIKKMRRVWMIDVSYSCLICGRTGFDEPLGHVCNNRFRDSGFKWQAIITGDNPTVINLNQKINAQETNQIQGMASGKAAR